MANKAQVEITAKNNTAAGFKEAETTAKEFAETIKSTLEPVLALLGAATVGEFFKAAIEESTKAQQNFIDISTALRNIGADAQVAFPQVQASIEEMTSKSGMNINDVNAAMTQMITLTGNYKTAMTALPTVLDVAAARHIDLNSAATLVGRAINGNSGALSRLGIVIKDGQTPFDALRAAYKGFAEEEGNTFAGTLGRIGQSWRDVLGAVGDAITGNAAMGESSSSLVSALKDVEKYIHDNSQTIADMTAVVLQLGKWLGWLVSAVLVGLVEDFKLVEAAVIGVTGGFMELWEGGKLAFGGLLSTIGNFVASASGVLDKFGIHFADGVGQRLQLAGQDMMKGATDAIAKINEQTKAGINDVLLNTAQKETPMQQVKAVPKDLSAGAQDTKQAGKDAKDFRDKVAGLTALLQLDDKRAAALAELNTLAAAELKIVNDKTASDKVRVTAAERYGQVIKAIQGDETTRFNDSLSANKALLDLDDKRVAALQQLKASAAQELAIANNTTASTHDRLQAETRYKEITDAIRSDETKHFNDSLSADKALLDLDDKRADALQDLNVMAAQQLVIANDMTVNDHDRLQAQTRYKEITDAIKTDDEKHFKDQLDNDKAHLQFADQHLAVMAKLRTEAESLKAITLDTSKTDKERIAAAQKLDAIISATGGKLHLAMTGTESFKAMTQALQDMAGEGTNLNNVLGELGGTTLNNLTSGLGEAFAAIGSGQGVFDTLSKAAKKSVADAAKVEGQLEFGRGMAALAAGLFPPNPAALASAAEHFAAGAFLETLGGALGSGGGKSSGGGGGASAGSSASQSQTALGNNQPTGQIIIQGGLLNMNDPAQADAFSDAIKQVTGTRLVVLSST